MISEVFIAILVTGVLWFSNGKAAVKTLSQNLSEEISRRVEDKINTLLDSARQHASSQADLFESGLIAIGSDNQQALTLAYQQSTLERNPGITTLFTCSPGGELVGLQREPDGGFTLLRSQAGKPGLAETFSTGEVLVDADFDATQRPWYQLAMEKSRSGWTPVYKFAGIPQLGLSAFDVHADGDEFRMISVCDLTLGPLNSFLSQLQTSENGQTAILDPEGFLVASSALDSVEEVKDKNGETVEYQRVKGLESKSPVIRESIRKLTVTFGDSSTWPEKGNLQFETEVGVIYLSWLSISLGGESRWINLLAIPRSDLTSETSQRTKTTAVAFLILILITIPLVWRTAEGITRPVMELNQGIDLISQFKIEDPENGLNFRPSRLRELSEMQMRMEGMQHALASFEKYVPSRVVRKLVTEDKIAVPGMEEATACIFFSDIVGFTEVAESLDPDLLVQLGGEYLEGMSQQIHQQGGIVDKFIGDAIMAFWIAEVDGKRVTAKACQAALLSQKSLVNLRKDWRRRDLPELRARIGLHTGPVRVGNIGSSTRLNYTILGDSVNLSSRLEGLNKIYGTEILVSEEVRSIARDEFHFRKLDQVSVKGRRKGGSVHELVCRTEEATQQQLDFSHQHEAALSEYISGDFEKAKNNFAELFKSYPDDRSIKIILDRCKDLIEQPPESWTGVISIDRNIKDNG